MRDGVRLSGRDRDLMTLAEAYPDRRDDAANVVIASPGVGHLYLADSDGMSNVELIERAQRVVKRMNALVAVRVETYRPVSVDGHIDTPDGRTHAVVQPKTIRAPATVHVGQFDSDWAARALELADKDENFERVLSHLVGEPTFLDLRKAKEILEKHFDFEAHTTDADHRAFRASAHLPEVSGEDALHAESDGSKPPKRTMTLSEARR